VFVIATAKGGEGSKSSGSDRGVVSSRSECVVGEEW